MNPPNTQKRNEILSMSALILVALLWGAGFIYVKKSLDGGLSASGVMFGRFGLGALLCFCVFSRTIRREYKKGQWKSGLVIGLILFGAFYMQTLAMRHTTPGNNAFITGAYVVMVPLLYWILTKKRPSAVMLVACFLSFAGIAILSLNPAEGFSPQLGDMLALLGALLFAAQIIATERLANSIHPSLVVFMQLTVAAGMSLVFFLATDGDFSSYANADSAVAICYLGLVSTCLCYVLQTFSQSHLSSSKTGIILSTESLFGALFSVLLGYDALTLRMTSGGLLMFASILLPELWKLRGQTKAPRN